MPINPTTPEQSTLCSGVFFVQISAPGGDGWEKRRVGGKRAGRDGWQKRRAGRMGKAPGGVAKAPGGRQTRAGGMDGKRAGRGG